MNAYQFTARALLCAGLTMSVGGCAQLLPVLAAVSQGAQMLGSLLDAGDAGADSYFAKHPHAEREAAVRDELKRLVRSGEFGALGGLQRPATILPPRAQALELVARGVTTVDEVRRVLVDETPAGAVATDRFSAGRSHPLRSAD